MRRLEKDDTVRTYQIVYASKAAIHFTAESLEELGTRAADSNRQVGITGMLLYSGGYFLQVLEGDKHFTQHLYEMIARDARHQECTIISEGYSTRRIFEKWSMGVFSLDHERRNFINDAKVLRTFSDLTNNVCQSKSTIAALKHFKSRLGGTKPAENLKKPA